ncbi:uncharacterized protein LOC132717809 [Ruditapes philippinarum]|uniref:uncharacterized protein LOC132717809 n=1 Tax=Ruditapes philippinarum TaxID=129788 RepID=UPI00295B14F1|nr:uncharacterized protein LOC132717809 [Ruditapes philippinarum]
MKSEFFHEEDKDNDRNDIPLVRNKTGWKPPKSKDIFLEEAIESLKEIPLENKSDVHSNLTKKDRSAFKSILSKKSLIIKEADKGGAVVCMDNDYYRDHILKMLSDESYYSETDINADLRTRKELNDIVNKHGKGLVKEESTYLTNFESSTSFFYGLPKIHKSRKIEEAINNNKSEYIKVSAPDDLKFRPIVGGPNSVTQRLSHFLDLILKPLCRQVPSFIRDDLDFLNYLPENVEEDSILVTLDVVNLYTNIPHDLGLQAIQHWIENFPDKIDTRFQHQFILKSLQLILKNNAFYFDGKYYIQNKGTAMGTKVAPTYATLVLGYLEKTLYERISTIHGNDFSNYIKMNWKRFLDDCFLIVWKNINTDDLLREINNLHPCIQFTMNKSETSMPFLDVLVMKSGTHITTDIYSKPTDTYNYLNFKSCHPKHTKLNIPFNLASRIITIVRGETLQEKRLSELTTRLKNQNYPDEIITYGISKAKLKGPIKTEENITANNKYNVITYI